MAANNVIEILDVSLVKNQKNSLIGCNLDQPKTGEKKDSYSFQFSGWIVGKSPAVSLNLISEGRLLQQIPVNGNRPGIAKRFPKVPGAEKSGFSTRVGVIGLPTEATLNLQVVFENGQTLGIGNVSFRHQPLRSEYQPKMQPLLVSSTGRSGTTWLMRLLSNHPQIVTSPNYPYESRAALYWMEMLKALSQPATPQMSNPEKGFENEMQWLGRNALYNSNISPPEVISWVERGYPELFAAFCQQSIDGFYQKMAESYDQQKSDVSASNLMYFAEKNPLNPTPLLELYPKGKEILLVRDFRDVICSILAFNTKRGYDDFGRQNFENDQDYIRSIARAFKQTLPKWKNRSVQTYLVRYEDLIWSPVEILSKLLEFLAVDHSSSRIETVLNKASEDTMSLKGHRTSSDPKASIGRWQNDLEPSLQMLCNEVFAEVLQEFGYVI